MKKNIPWKGRGQSHVTRFRILHRMYPQRLTLETTNFVHVKSYSLVMSECSLSGRGQGHVSNFYIVDLENFATASRRYRPPTGDIHNSVVRSRFVYDTYNL